MEVKESSMNMMCVLSNNSEILNLEKTIKELTSKLNGLKEKENKIKSIEDDKSYKVYKYEYNRVYKNIKNYEKKIEMYPNDSKINEWIKYVNLLRIELNKIKEDRDRGIEIRGGRKNRTMTSEEKERLNQCNREYNRLYNNIKNYSNKIMSNPHHPKIEIWTEKLNRFRCEAEKIQNEKDEIMGRIRFKTNMFSQNKPPIIHIIQM
jgi:hypothetical protein